MHKDKYVFAQLVSFLDRNHFNYLVRKYGGDKYVKFFSCWNQLLTLMFGQLSNRESLRDLIVAINAHQKKSYHLGFGLVRYWDEELNREFTYLTNAKHLSALQIANLYKNKWQVELFFKWLKQHLKIKKFWGTTENAVRIQIYAAISAYCLVDT